MSASTAAPALASVPFVEPVTVQAAIAAVIAEMPAISKGQTAPGAMGGFAFRGIEDITTVTRPILARHGVVITPRQKLLKVVPAPGQKEAWQDVYLEVEWLVTGPDGSTITGQTIGIGRDNTDKGGTKAGTQAYKVFLIELLNISDSKDDGDGADYSLAAAPTPVVDPLKAQVQQWVEDSADSVRAEFKAWWEKNEFRYSTLTAADRAAILKWWQEPGMPNPIRDLEPNEEPF